MDWQVLHEIAVTGESHMSTMDKILSARGVKDRIEFMTPSLYDLRHPRSMFHMGHAVDSTMGHIASHGRIWIYGDYDADGINATTVMVLGFRGLGVNVRYYIPERHEGYGLNIPAINYIHKEGCDLLITCDTGITAKEEVEYAKSLGIQVIITDHHTVQEDLLPDCITVNPQHPRCTYGFRELSGSGVAYTFMRGLYGQLHNTGGAGANFLLPWAALGTVADVMPLVEDNRIIVQQGLEMASSSKNFGMINLLRVLGLEDKKLTAHHVGFMIGPVLNATGRLAFNKEGKSVSPRDAVEMFLDKSRLRTYRIAEELKELNRFRQELTTEYAKKIIDCIDASTEHLLSKVMVVPYPDLPEGLVGLIAGKLKEKYNRPVLLMTNASETECIGSGRSISAYNMFDELSRLGNYFTKFGGHAMACGFTIEAKNIDLLRSVLNSLCTLSADDIKPTKQIEFLMDGKSVTLGLAEELQNMEPFGKGNPRPTFAFNDVDVASFQQIGKEKQHLKINIVTEDNYEFECIGFNLVEKFEEMGKPKQIDLIFYPQVNEWNNRRKLQLKIEDFREAGDLVPMETDSD